MANTGSHDVHREQYPAPKPLGLDLIPMGVLPYDFCMLLCVSFIILSFARRRAEVCVFVLGGLEVGYG